MSNGPFYAAGRYLCCIEQQGMSEASTGTPQYVIRFTVLGKVEYDGIHDVAAQYSRTSYRAITDKTIDWVAREMQTLGFNGNSFSQFDPSFPGHISVVGKEIEMLCQHENDPQGNLREKWRVATGGGDIEIKPMGKDKMRRLDSMFGKSLKNGSPKPVTLTSRSSEPPPAAQWNADEEPPPF